MEEKRNTILLVDDDSINIRILTAILNEKYDLMTAYGGKMALDLIEQEKNPDLVLLDIMMPDLDGYSVCTLLKSDEKTKDIPIIFISAMGQIIDEEEGLNLGAVDYIKKPFVSSIVLARVETQLKLSNSLRKIKKLFSKSTIMNRLINYKNHQIEMILNHSGEGYFIIDPDLYIQSEHSKECDRIFGVEISGKNLLEVFSTFNGFNAKIDEEVLSELFCLSDQKLSEKADIYLELLPNELEKAGQFYHVKYSMIITENIGKRLLIVLENITEKRLLQKRLEDERQNLRMIVNVVSNVERYQLLFKSAVIFFKETIYNEIKKRTDKAILDIYIRTHTFKGLFGQFNIKTCHTVLEELETLLSQYSKTIHEASLFKLLKAISNLKIPECLEEINKMIEEYIGFEILTVDYSHQYMIVNQANYNQIIETIKENPTINGKTFVLSQIEKIKYKSLGTVLRKLCNYSKRLSIDLGKEQVTTSIVGEDVFLDPLKYGSLMDSLVHIFRNIVDHGIEMPHERYQKGKSPIGRIECSIHLNKDEVILTITDDGKGIDFGILRHKIKQIKGLSNQSAECLSEELVVNTLFEEGFSSVERDHSFSGSGMGLSAVKKALDEIGGTIRFESQKNQGSRFIIRFQIKGDEDNSKDLNCR